MLTAPILPYVLLAAVSATSLAGVGGYLAGRSDGKALQSALAARDAEIVETVAAAAQQAAAREIAAITITNTTIRQTVENKTRENAIYRDCRHADGVLDTVNQALANTARAGQLPAAGAADRPDIRRDHPEAGRGRRPISPVPSGRTGGAP